MENKDPEYTRLYAFVRGLFAVILKLLCRVRYHNVERLSNLEGPCILMGNHQSWLDPVLLAVPCKHIQLRILGKKELNKSKFMQWATPKMHMIAVDRHESDLAAMRTCSKTLKDGHVLMIFPEGTRHQPSLMHEVETGAAVLALRAKVPMIPCYIHGKPGFFRSLDVYVGTPMENDDLYAEGANMEVADKLCRRIRDTYFAMRDAAVREAKK